MRVRVILRQPLFTLPDAAAHVPPKETVIDGTSEAPGVDGVRLSALEYRDERGRPLEGAPCELLIPAAKIDHIVLLG